MTTISHKCALLCVVATVSFGFAGAASAVVDFDPEVGEGFVGKGDVQNAFGWNNKTLQQDANNVGFKYKATDKYEAVCTFQTGGPNPQTQTPTRTRTTAVDGVPDADPRKKAGQTQFTGFDLSGWLNDPTETGDPVPVVDGPCPGGPNGGTWTSVTGPTTTDSLLVTYNGIAEPIWP